MMLVFSLGVGVFFKYDVSVEKEGRGYFFRMILVFILGEGYFGDIIKLINDIEFVLLLMEIVFLLIF